jgi:hypothetical protein
MRVIGWLGDFSACGHYRLYYPFQVNKWAVTDRAIMDADVIVAQRVVDPVPTRCFQQVVADPSKVAVLELDDNLFAPDLVHPTRGHFEDQANQRRLINNLETAQLVTVSTEPLANVARQYTDRVVVLENYIPELLLHIERPVNDRIVIGWGGSATHVRCFGEVARPLKRILQKYGDRVEFHCLGNDYTHRVASVRGRTRFTGWVDDVWSYYDHIDFDISLAPLHMSLFNESRSDLRLKEMAALGVPTIASNVGPYEKSMQEGCPAIPVETHKEWERALVDLIEDTEHRKQLSDQARAWAAPLTIEANAQRWRDTYEQVWEARVAC